MSALPGETSDPVRMRAQGIQSSLEADTGPLSLRAAQVELSRLRALFRRNPALFSSETLGMLQSLSGRLKSRSEQGLGETRELALGALRGVRGPPRAGQSL